MSPSLTKRKRGEIVKLLQRIKYAFKYDFESDFIVYSIPDQSAMRFTNYEDARKFSDGQIQYRPKVMIAIHSKPEKES